MEIETGSTPSHEVDSNAMKSSSRVREKVDPAWEYFSCLEKSLTVLICLVKVMI